MNAPECMPTVMVDTALGRDFVYLDVDVPGIVEHMRGQGLADRDIAATTIRLTDEIPEYIDNTPGVRGVYRHRAVRGVKKCAWVTVRPYVDDYKMGKCETPDESTSRMSSEILVHELQHRAFAKRGNKPAEIRSHERGTIAMLGAYAVPPFAAGFVISERVENYWAKVGALFGGFVAALISGFKNGERLDAAAY